MLQNVFTLFIKYKPLNGRNQWINGDIEDI